MAKFDIRPVTTLDEMNEVVSLQRVAWDDPTALVHRNQLVSFSRNGGLLLAAYDGDRMVGFVLGYLGTYSQDTDRPAMANLKLVSQRMAVLPEYRNKGLGYELKLAQRDHAIKQGIRLITWTFDPLQSRNAHLNIRKLGAISREYWQDYYGTEPSPYVVLGSSDRLVAEWWVTNNRVEQRVNGHRSGLTLAQYMDGNATLINPSREGRNGYPEPSALTPQSTGMIILLEIPSDYGAIAKTDPDLGKAWRQHTRELFKQSFVSRYMITDFVHAAYEGRERSFYALTYAEAPSASGFSSN